VVAPPKSKAVAALLCFFFGGLGIHRFYTGQVGLGLALLLTTFFLGWTIVWLLVTFVWVVVDFVLILTGSVKDQHGRPLT
jgi:TM2 domain-containing membrane protein YozV